MKQGSMKKFLAVFVILTLCLTTGAPLYADEAAPLEDSTALGQFPQAEVTPLPQAQSQMTGVDAGMAGVAGSSEAFATSTSSDTSFPKVATPQGEELAKRFSWWPTDAKPGPVKDTDRSGYWWWPDAPGQQTPWGNRGYIYIIKVIFDYKSTEGEMKPSLVIKKILKNVKAYFDFDKYDLRDDTREILSQAVWTLERNPQADILITGNADVRGSEQYNMKLGENRAAAVRQFMLDHNIPEERIRILSRGKLDAIAPKSDIVGMQKDRNAQFMIAEVEEIMIPASQAHLFEDKVIEEQQTVEGEVKVGFEDYVIQAGDTLWKIAEREYGHGRHWKRIYEFNKDVIADPNKPKKGTTIRLPQE